MKVLRTLPLMLAAWLAIPAPCADRTSWVDIEGPESGVLRLVSVNGQPVISVVGRGVQASAENAIVAELTMAEVERCGKAIADLCTYIRETPKEEVEKKRGAVFRTASGLTVTIQTVPRTRAVLFGVVPESDTNSLASVSLDETACEAAWKGFRSLES